MRKLAEQYPAYRLEAHKGYPTAEHIRLLREHGPCEIYRRSFCAEFWAIPHDPAGDRRRANASPQKLYRKAGYEIAARNYACRFGEIDIICENAEYIVFAEVKARELSSAYLPREAVTSAETAADRPQR